MSRSAQEPTDLVLQPTDNGSAASMPDAMAKALTKAGVNINAVSVPDVAIYVPVELEALCVRPSNFKDAVGETSLMVVTSVQEFPEADKYEDYLGFFRVECVTSDGEFVSWSSHMYAKATSEAGPLYAYVHAGITPFYIKVVRIKTAREGRHVFRPAPVPTSAG